jgi:hypothetical protein
VRTTTGRPPEGFPGNDDWWHHHPWICYRKSDARMVSFNQSDASCTQQQGVNVDMSRFYMLHVWVLDQMKFVPDVFAGMMPCISGGTATSTPATRAIPRGRPRVRRAGRAGRAAGETASVLSGDVRRASVRTAFRGHSFVCSLA